VTLLFHIGDHTYTLDGKAIPGVTTVMQPFIGAEFRFVDAAVLKAAQERGTSAHAMISQEIKEGIGLSDVAFDMIPYYEAWMDFKLRSGFRPIFSEEKVYSRKYGYAGTLDLFGELNNRLILPDIKCVTSLARSTGPQTAAYLQALREAHPEYSGAKIDRAALQFTPDGKWKLHPLDNKDDLKTFLSCINIYNHIRKLS
jgi:hypothetical protein